MTKQLKKKIEMVDFLKGYSIFTILIFHCLNQLKLAYPFNQFIYFGGTGVHLFVFMSGFGLYYSYLKNPISYPLFLKKRFLKVYVPYLLVVLLSALVALVIPIYKTSVYALLGHVFLYKMFDESIIGSYGYPLWFISMILQFYLVFYGIVFIKKKVRNYTFLLSCVAISIGWSLLVYLLSKGTYRTWNSFFLQYVWEFALGMVAAQKLFERKMNVFTFFTKTKLLLIGAVCCAIYALLGLKGGIAGRLFNDYFALIGYSFVAVWLYLLHLPLVTKFFLFVGRISLSVYLLHVLVLLLCVYFTSLPLYGVLLALLLIFPLATGYQKLIQYFFKATKL